MLGLAIAALGAASAWAATIHGNAKANSLHGSATADKLYGLGGNDKLYGLAGNDKLYGGAGNDKLYGGAGNDLLVGGPGADLLSCGPGHDTAMAGKGDKVSGCEVVKGLPPAPRPPTPTPPPTTNPEPTTTATTTTVAAPQFESGRYCGFTNNGGSICFDITPAPYAWTNGEFQTSFDSNDCSPPASGSVDYTTSGSAAVQADGSFDFNIQQGDEAGTDVKGTVDTAGGATGTLHLHSVVQDSAGNSYTCTLDATWSAKKQ